MTKRVFAILRRWPIGPAHPLLASFDPFITRERRPLQDVVACIRQHRLDAAGYRLAGNAERHMKPVAEAQRLFADYPQALANIEKLWRRVISRSMSWPINILKMPSTRAHPAGAFGKIRAGRMRGFPMVCLINSTG